MSLEVGSLYVTNFRRHSFCFSCDNLGSGRCLWLNDNIFFILLEITKFDVLKILIKDKIETIFADLIFCNKHFKKVE
jgi:hypothetical protein